MTKQRSGSENLSTIIRDERHLAAIKLISRQLHNLAPTICNARFQARADEVTKAHGRRKATKAEK
jgi:hypothetical protein